MVEHPKNPPAQSRQVLSRAKRTLRWWQFSLRTLLLFTTACAGAAWWISYPLERARQQRIAVARLRDLGARITYDYEIADFDAPHTSALNSTGQTPPAVEPPGPGWILWLLGVDFLSRPVQIEADCDDPSRRPAGQMPKSYLRREDLTLLTKLPQLKDVIIHGGGCDDSSLDFLGSLKKRQKLTLEGVLTDAGLGRISQLEQLTELTLASSKAITERGLAQLVALSSLEALDLSFTNAKGSWLRHLARLKRLHSLSHTPGFQDWWWTDEDLLGVAMLTHLTHLNLWHENISDVGIEHLATLSDLEELHLEQTHVHGEGFARLAGLQNLHTVSLDSTELTDSGLQALAKLPHLRSLSLKEETKITDVGLGELARATELEELDLSSTRVDGSAFSHLDRLVRLKRLALGGTEFSDVAMQALKNYPQLESLGLCSPLITNRGLTNLAGLSRLEDLDLSQTGVTDAGLRQLGGLKCIRRLNLAFTSITDAGLIHLRTLTKLESLDVANTAVTAAGVAKIKQFFPRADIHQAAYPVGMSGMAF